MLNNRALLNFDDTAREMLALLRERLPFDLWMITRVEGDDWIVLYANDQSYGVSDGDVFRWTDSFCYRMVSDGTLRVVPDCKADLVYADAPIGQQIPIGAYIGIPLLHDDNRLFGTLCAIHPTPLPDSIVDELPLIEILAKMLSIILGVCLEMSSQARNRDQSSANYLKDDATGLYSLSGWEQLLDSEGKRCRLYGHPACIISVHLNDLGQVYSDRGPVEGERYLVRLAQIVQSTARKQDIVARVGNDTFAILVIESTLAEGTTFLERLKLYLRLAQLNASTAIAVRGSKQYQLLEVWQQAQQAVGVAT
ncbi:MAG: diguanylate cyclase [Elainellaceae cyanobacterium]